MAIAIRPAAGTTISVSAAAPATFDAAGYDAVSSYTEVKGFDTLGTVGGAMEVGNFDSLTDGRMKFRGTEDPGEFEAAPADLPKDPGQVILKAAFDAGRGTSGEKVSVKIEDEAGFITYAQCLVSTWSRTYGGAMDIIIRNVTMPIVAGTVVEVDPS